MKVRFYATGYDNPVQDHVMAAYPRLGERVELGGPDGFPQSFIVTQVTVVLHDVIPADVVVELSATRP